MQTGIKSFVESAANSLFSIHNLPYGVFYHKDHKNPHIGVAIGTFVLDLTVLEKAGLLKSRTGELLFNSHSLNIFAAQGKPTWNAIRQRIQSLLDSNNDELQKNKSLLSEALISQSNIKMLLPFKIEGYSDFYASEHHATNVGKLFRGKENALLPNWKFLPVGYNGRASTVFLSGTDIIRPKGQIKTPDSDTPIFEPTKKLDFELEIGFFIGAGNPDRRRINVDEASDHIFGLVLLNDWSARDIQSFEYQPLGPFLSKSFATSISPWVVPFEALQGVMTALPKQSPENTNYLKQTTPMLPNIKLKVEIQPKNSSIKTSVCETNLTELYWSMEQMLAHHTVNHCILNPGDLLGTGTISGVNRENWGSMLEISFNGMQPIKLTDGIERTFLEDGDTVIITGYCETKDYKIGFGSLEGKVTAAICD